MKQNVIKSKRNEKEILSKTDGYWKIFWLSSNAHEEFLYKGLSISDMREVYRGVVWQYHSVCCISYIHSAVTILHYGLCCDIYRLVGTILRYTRINEYSPPNYRDYRWLCIDNAILYGNKVCGTTVLELLTIRQRISSIAVWGFSLSDERSCYNVW